MSSTLNVPVNPQKPKSEGRLRSGDEAFQASVFQAGDAPQAAKGRPFMASFLEHLVRNQVVTEEVALQVAHRRQDAGKDKRRLVEILADEFGLSRELLYREVAKFYSFRIIELSDRSARRLPAAQVNKLLTGLPEPTYELAVKHKVLPYEIADQQPDKLLVVTPNPSDREAYDVARLFPYKKFEICYMTEADWAELWRQVNLEKQMSVSGGGTGVVDSVFEEDEAQLDSVLEREINRSQLVSMVENVLTDAVRVGASDIHVAPRGARKTDIMFRIDGRLKLWYTVEDARAEAVVAVVKGRGLNLDRFERMAAQDGSAQKPIDNQMIRFRISVIPIISRELAGKFESVVIRILRDADASVSLPTIGFDAYSLAMFEQAIHNPHGMVILTGPTGSGKSTTLVAALRSVMNSALNTITVEDPVEYLLEGARQVKLSHKLDFDNAMRAILRHDPDIVMVGEIRDRITADIAVKLANTGHLTFSTLHTNDAPSAVSRLFKLGIEPFLIAQALNIVVGQRLVRKLCDRCKTPAPPAPVAVLERAGFSPEEAKTVSTFRAVGCINCVEGYKGRTAIHESLFINPEIRSMIMESGDRIDIDALRQAGVRNGMRSLRAAGLDLVKRGVTTLEEIISSTIHE
jgi:type IV pilus assembly protein PilB